MVWTKDEENLLLELKSGQRIKYEDILHHFPNRTKGQVKSKYDSLMRAKKNKKHNYDTTPRKRWTQKEIDILKNNAKADWEVLLKLLPDRSHLAIHRKINELKMYRNDFEVTPAMEKYIYDNYLLKTNQEIGKEIGLSPSTVYNIGRRLELTPQNERWNLHTIETDPQELSFTCKLTLEYSKNTKGRKLYGKE